MRSMVSFFVVALALLVLPEDASAQFYGQYGYAHQGGLGPFYGQRLPVYGNWYGGYVPPVPMLPPVYGDARDFYGRKLPPIEVEECRYVECNGLRGTFHAERGELHFRPHDSTHSPFNMNHRNCLVIESVSDDKQGARQSTARRLPESSNGLEQTKPATSDCKGRGMREIRNNTGLTIEVTKDDRKFLVLPTPEGVNSYCVGNDAGASYRATAEAFVEKEVPDGQTSVRPIRLIPVVEYDKLVFNTPSGR